MSKNNYSDDENELENDRVNSDSEVQHEEQEEENTKPHHSNGNSKKRKKSDSDEEDHDIEDEGNPVDYNDSSEEDEDEPNTYQVGDGFVVNEDEDDDDDEEEEEEVVKEKEKKKKKHRRLKKLKIFEPSTKNDDSDDIFEEEDRDNGEFIVSGSRPKSKRDDRHSSKIRDIFGGDDDFEMEGDDIMEGDEEEMQIDDSEKPIDKMAMIREQYEPSLLEEKHFTEADEEIRMKNIPERYQHRKGTQYTNDRATYEQAEWIYDTAFDRKERRDDKQIEVIASILKLIQKDQLEIPYIFTYEKDVFEPDFNEQDLWRILDLDEKWNHLKNSKKNLDQLLANNQSHLESYRGALNDCKTEESVTDLHDLFSMINSLNKSSQKGGDKDKDGSNNGHGGELVTQSSIFEDFNTTTTPTPTSPTLQQPKRPKRAIKRDLYTIYHKAGLKNFLSNYGMSAQDFGTNLVDSFMTIGQNDPDIDTKTAARSYICVEAGTEEEVLKVCRYMMAQEIGYDPYVRQNIRSLYRKFVHLSTYPTNKGIKDVDVFHPYYSVRAIKQKPCSMFQESSQYLLILKAEKEGFITTKLEVRFEDILPDMERVYLSDGTSSVSQQWNEQRRLIIRQVLERFLFPLFEKEIRNILLTDASINVANDCALKLEDKIRVLPWEPSKSSSSYGSDGEGERDNDEEEFSSDNEDGGIREKKSGPNKFRIMSFVNGTDSTSTIGVVLDREGEVVTHTKLEFLCDRMMGDIMSSRKTKDTDTLSEMLRLHQPRLILISATDLGCRRLMDEINELVKRLRDDGLLKKSVDVTFYNPEIGNSLQTSQRYCDEFKDFSTPLRHAVAIGRCVLDPLVEYSSLCNDSHDILYLKIHPLQDMVARDFLAKTLHRSFINVVNAVGIDINRIVKNRFTSPPLQFLSGFGSRKAQMLINILNRKGGYVTSRNVLTKMLNQDVVDKNAIGFVQIKRKYLHSSQHKVDRLDETRIHPDSYQIAYRIAAEALERELNESKLQEYVDKVMHRPFKLEKLDLDQFADTLEERVGRPMRRTLNFIRQELTHPFQDIRRRYEAPSSDDIFNWLTGESDQTLRNGTLLSVTTIRSFDNGVKVRLENGIEGTIESKNISDDGETKSIPRGTTLNCRVVSIDRERFQIGLTCKPSDLDISRWESEMNFEITMHPDNKYLLTGDDVPRPQDLTKKIIPQPRRRISRTKRVVIHPLWHSFSCLDAEKYLNDKPVGEAILRPSSKGMDHITVTFKFWHGIILHHDIKEGDKPNAVSLGKSFYIGENKFDSLDEILAHHVEYLINNLNDVRSNQHWRDGTQDVIDRDIRQEKISQPNTIPYSFGINHQLPGFITLYHVPNSTPRHEQILIKDDGFLLRKKLFPTLQDLIKYFKQNYAQLLQNRGSISTSSSSSTSNNVPSSSSSSSSSGLRLPTNNEKQPHQSHQPPTQRPMYSNQPSQQPYRPQNIPQPVQSYQQGPPSSQQPQQPYRQPYQQQGPPQYQQGPPPPQPMYNQPRSQSNWNQPPPQYQQGPPQQQQYNYDNRRPPQYQQGPPQYQQGPPQYQQGPPQQPMYNQPPQQQQYNNYDNRGNQHQQNQHQQQQQHHYYGNNQSPMYQQ